MKVVALVSGGKDSCYNMMQCISEGHEIVALANLKPKDKDELDSYMYQTVGHHAIDLYAEAMELPLYRHTIEGSSSLVGMDYSPTPGDEVEDLYTLLKKIKDELQIEAVSAGAILSDYQRVRVENVCHRLGLTSLAYLWRRDQSELLKEMIDCGISAVLIKVASYGLTPKKHLGKTIKELYPQLKQMNREFELNVCGEGGEYETFTTDCPLFNKSIVLDSVEEVLHSDDDFAPVGYLNLKSAHLENKTEGSTKSLLEKLSQYPLKRSSDIHKELFCEEEISDLKENTSEHFQVPVCKCAGPVEIKAKYTKNELWITGITIELDSNHSTEDLTKMAMDKLKDSINGIHGNWSLRNLCMIHLYVSDLKDFVAINSVYKTYFGLNPPSRVCVQVPLPENIALQLDCYGYHGDDRTTMHVQSISHWAAANIGPYSQCVKVKNKRLYVAGQIAMIPATLQIINSGIRAEARLSIRHVERILLAMPGNASLQNISLAICYVTKRDYVAIAKEEWFRYNKGKKYNESYSEVSSWFSTKSSLLEFVIVPKLPRNAKIEWQVYADTTDDEKKVDSVIRRCDIYEAVAHYQVSNSSLSCIITVDTSVDKPKDGESIIRCFCGCYKEVVDKSGVDWKTLPTLQIFYPISQFSSYDDLIKGLKEQFPTDVIFTIVPVIELSLPDTLLLGCH